MFCAKVIVTLIGIALEVTGAGLAFWPQLAPRLQRGKAAVRRAWTKTWLRLRLLLRRPPKAKHEMAAMAGAYAIGGRATGFATVPDDASDERKLAFAVEQVVEAQKRLDKVESRLADHPKQWRLEIDAVRSALEERLAQEIQEQEDLFIGRRLVGLALIVTGSILLGVANLL